MHKYILQILNENGDIEDTYYFKSLKAINSHLKNVEYHQLRTIYQQSKKNSKFLHPHIQVLYSQFRILDNPDNKSLQFVV